MNSRKKTPKRNDHNKRPLEGGNKLSASQVTVADNSLELTPLKFAVLSSRSREALEIVQDGVLSELQEYLGKHENRKTINRLDEAGAPLLHYAVRSNHVEATRMLIDHGSHVDVRSHDGSTPLHVAARFDCRAVADLLLNLGANPSLADSLNNTPLHHAVRRRNKDIVDLLVGRTDIDINARTHGGMTTLHLVAMNGDLEICRLLLSKGADIQAKTADCATALHSAIFSCNANVADLLIKKASLRINVADFLNQPDLDQDTALHLAVETGNVTSVELCLKHGAQVNAQRVTLLTPLHIAAMKGDFEVVKILCREGADLHMKDTEKQTPLHRAAAEDRADVIKLLLENGAQIDIRSKDNRTPFLTAVAAGRVESARVLLESGADAESCTSLMENCIHLAVYNSHLEMVQLLLENQQAIGNLYKPDISERFPIHYGAIAPDIKILDLLLTKYSRVFFQDQNQQTPLHLAAKSGRVGHVEALGKVMSGVNERDDHGMTPIHLAAMNGNRKACHVLARIGADVNARDNDRWTPLMWAAWSGCDKTSKELLDKQLQAVINHVNIDNNTALHIACSRGNVSVVELLLNAAASVCVLNSAGQSCLEMAVESGAGDIALALAKHKRWPEILDCPDAKHQPPMKILIEYFPEAAEIVMDHCIKCSSHIPTDPNFTVHLDFHLLDPGPDDEANLEGNRFFGPTTMVQFSRQKLLLHPLTQKLLDVKWVSFGRFIYYFNLLTFMVFLISYTVFVITEREAQTFNSTKKISSKTGEQNMTERVTVSDIFTRPTAFNGGVLFIALIFAGANIIKEVFQLVVQRRRYFSDPSNITEWALYLSTLCFMMPYLLTPTQLEMALGSLEDPRNLWIAGIISIFLCYFNVILFLRRFQLFGIYVSMFVGVTVTLVRVMLVFFIFVISFAIVFFILFKEQDAFQSFGFSIVKVAVMMVGEFDYDATFVDSINKTNDVTGNPLNPFPEFGLIFISFFLFIMSIILMNLLVGLAVGDIESVQRNATLQRMAMQVSFVAEVEDKYPRFITRRIYNPGREFKPNKTRSTIRRFREWLTGQANLYADAKPSLSCEEKTESSLREIRQQMRKTKKRVKTLVEAMEAQNRLLTSMAQKMNLEIEFEELDAKDWVEPSHIDSVLLADKDDTDKGSGYDEEQL